jgi:hypothetical protein
VGKEPISQQQQAGTFPNFLRQFPHPARLVLSMQIPFAQNKQAKGNRNLGWYHGEKVRIIHALF